METSSELQKLKYSQPALFRLETSRSSQNPGPRVWAMSPRLGKVSLRVVVCVAIIASPFYPMVHIFDGAPTLSELLRWTDRVKALLQRRPPPPPAQTPGCRLLFELPQDVLLSIFDWLSPETRILFAMTCVPLRRLAQQYPATCRPDTSELSKLQVLEFCMALVRDRPMQWACELCSKLHSVTGSDRANARADKSISRVCAKARYNDSSLFYASYWPRHRHVQLALKHRRLDEEGRLPFLYRLLSPKLLRTEKHDVRYMRKVLIKSRIYGMIRTMPRICNGRYLLQVEAKYSCLNRRDWDPDAFLGGWIRHAPDVCPHQTFHFGQGGARTTDGVMEYIMSSNDRQHAQTRRMLQSAYETKGSTQASACTRCPTDFSIQMAHRDIIVHLWHDLGPEGSITDRIWEVHSLGELRTHKNGRWKKPVRDALEIKALSVREAYLADVERAEEAERARQARPRSLKKKMRDSFSEIRARGVYEKSAVHEEFKHPDQVSTDNGHLE